MTSKNVLLNPYRKEREKIISESIANQRIITYEEAVYNSRKIKGKLFMPLDTTIESAEYYEDYKITIIFSDGMVNVFNYESLVMRDHEESKPYRDIENFKKFHIIEGRKEIAWGENWAMILPLETLYYQTKFNTDEIKGTYLTPYHHERNKEAIKAVKEMQKHPLTREQFLKQVETLKGYQNEK